MAVTRATERVKVKLIDGNDVEVNIYKYLTTREKQSVISEAFDGIKVKKFDESEFEASKLFSIITKLAEVTWADKNVTLDEVEGDSLSEVMVDRFESFLGGLGFKRKNHGRDGLEHGQDQ
jgi:hypothetical protein